MNSIQKVIKYCAMAFALFLAVTIFGAIIAAITGVARGVAGITEVTEDKERIQLEQSYTEAEIADLGIHSIFVDCNADITVQRGDILSIEAFDVTEDYEISCVNGKVSIIQEEEDFVFRFKWVLWDNSATVRESVVVTVPESFVAEQVVIHSGSGRVSVTELQTDELRIDSGSGAVAMDNIVTERLSADSGSGKLSMENITASATDLDTGSGSVSVEDSELGRLLMESGSGAVNMKNVIANDVMVDSGSGTIKIAGVLTGDCEFQTGSGSATVAIDGAEEEYRVKAECGSGSFRINGKKMEDGVYGTDVKGTLNFDSGSGSVNVEFNTPVEE